MRSLFALIGFLVVFVYVIVPFVTILAVALLKLFLFMATGQADVASGP